MEKKAKPFVLRMNLDLFNQLETGKKKAVMMAILSFSNNGKGKCFAGTREIAKRAGYSIGTVVAVKNELLKQGVLKQAGRKKTIGGWTDILCLSVQPVNTLKAKNGENNESCLSVQGVNASVQKRPKKRSRGELIQLKKLYKERIYKKEKKLVPLKKKYATLESLTEGDLVEIAIKYRVPLVLVKLCQEKMTNWCESKGKIYKDYKRALMNWVLTEAQRQVEGGGKDDRKRGIDARHIA